MGDLTGVPILVVITIAAATMQIILTIEMIGGKIDKPSEMYLPFLLYLHYKNNYPHDFRFELLMFKFLKSVGALQTLNFKTFFSLFYLYSILFCEILLSLVELVSIIHTIISGSTHKYSISIIELWIGNYCKHSQDSH